MKFNIETLKQYEKDKWIYSHYHKELPLILWNYSQFTQYEGKWDEITLNCRGLVTDLEGNVVSKGFSKFFNYSEGKTNIPENINNIAVYDKLDGSYIGLFYYENQWIVNSKGSFYSDQVNWAKEVLEEYNLNLLNEELTYCFELIYSENRIVCDYGDEKDLYFLAAFDNYTNLEVGLLERPKQFKHAFLNFESSFKPQLLKELNYENKEGFVIRFDNGERCKIKFDEYLRLHRIVTNTTSYDIWECLKNNDSFEEILDRTPDEFNTWIKETKIKILKNFYEVKYEIYEQYLYYLAIKDDKDFALKVKDNLYKPQLFALRNNKNIDDWVWSHIKPKFDKPFTK